MSFVCLARNDVGTEVQKIEEHADHVKVRLSLCLVLSMYVYLCICVYSRMSMWLRVGVTLFRRRLSSLSPLSARPWHTQTRAISSAAATTASCASSVRLSHRACRPSMCADECLGADDPVNFQPATFSMRFKVMSAPVVVIAAAPAGSRFSSVSDCHLLLSVPVLAGSSLVGVHFDGAVSHTCWLGPCLAVSSLLPWGQTTETSASWT